MRTRYRVERYWCPTAQRAIHLHAALQTLVTNDHEVDRTKATIGWQVEVWYVQDTREKRLMMTPNWMPVTAGGPQK